MTATGDHGGFLPYQEHRKTACQRGAGACQYGARACVRLRACMSPGRPSRLAGAARIAEQRVEKLHLLLIA